MATKKSIEPKVSKTKPSETKADVAARRLYRNDSPALLVESILFLGIAAVIFFNPIGVLTGLTAIFGVVLVLVGLYQVLIGLFGNRALSYSRAGGVIFGIIGIVLGMIFLLYPMHSMIMLIYMFAALFLLKAIFNLTISLDMWRAHAGHYGASAFLSFVMIALALMILFFPKFGAVTIMYYIAITLVFYAIVGLYMYFELLNIRKASV